MNRSVLDPADRFRVQHKLDRNETLVWVGRPVPTFRYRGWIGTVLFAVPWCAITGTFVVGVLIPAWMGKPVDGEAWGIWPKLGLTAFLTPFILIGIGTLFSPLWHKLSQQGQLYAVTDKRSFVIGRFFTKSWRGSEMFEPDRADRRKQKDDRIVITVRNVHVSAEYKAAVVERLADRRSQNIDKRHQGQNGTVRFRADIVGKTRIYEKLEHSVQHQCSADCKCRIFQNCFSLSCHSIFSFQSLSPAGSRPS